MTCKAWLDKAKCLQTFGFISEPGSPYVRERYLFLYMQSAMNSARRYRHLRCRSIIVSVILHFAVLVQYRLVTSITNFKGAQNAGLSSVHFQHCLHVPSFASSRRERQLTLTFDLDSRVHDALTTYIHSVTSSLPVLMLQDGPIVNIT